MNKKSRALFLVGIIFVASCFFDIVLSFGEAEEGCGSSINWEKWDEKTLLKDFESGTMDPCFRKFFDRDPQRIVPDEKKIIIAPADGRIVEIKSVGDRVIIRIFISLWDIHVQRIPIKGKVVSVEEKKGKYLPTQNEKHVTENYQVITTLDTAIGAVSITQIAGLHANRIKTFVKRGDEVDIGGKLGRILLGSTALLELPGGVDLAVKKNQKVYGGETIIGRY